MRFDPKFVLLAFLYICVVLYLALQYSNGMSTTKLEALADEVQRVKNKCNSQSTLELQRYLKLKMKYRALKIEYRESTGKRQEKCVPVEKPSPVISEASKPFLVPNVEKPLETVTLIPDDKPEIPIETHQPVIINVEEMKRHKDADKYSDIDADVHAQISGENVIPIIVFTHDRAEYLKKTLDTIFKYMPGEGFVVFVSQDGNMETVTRMVQSYSSKLIHLVHPRDFIVPPEKKQYALYHAISQHYKWALEKVFANSKFNRVIILEEDIEIAPDFFTYFERLSPILDQDKTIMCVSCWNDNGQATHVKDNTLLYRSDFFPGLGWMMSREMWKELHPKWPLGFWDDWLRQPEQRKDRACIFPEVSRTFTFGKQGVSGGQFYDTHLSTMKLNQEIVPWASQDVSYLTQAKYDPYFEGLVGSAILLADVTQLSQHSNANLKLMYNSLNEYNNFAKHFGLMGDPKKGVPRGAYKGIVTFRNGSNRIFLTPSRPNLTYETS